MACCLLLVLCALLSIVFPLPSCYLIIVSVAPPVSPSLPSFVSLFILLVSVVLCWSVVFRRVCVMLTATVLCLPACFSPSKWFLFIFVFILLLKTRFPCIWVLAISLLTHPDRTDQPCENSAENQPAKIGPAGRLFNILQGDGKIEYARHFLGVARRSATEKTCLMVIFWGGLAKPFKSRMHYWVPEESLEDYINLALNLSGSAFRMELAVEPAPFREPIESTPEPAPFREPIESTPEPAPFREPTESAPELAPFREPTESAPEPAPFREPTESAPEPPPFREPTESAPSPVPWAHRACSIPWAHRVSSRARSIPGAHRDRSVLGYHRVHSVPGAHRATLAASYSVCPALAPLSAYSSRPSSTPWAWPTVPTPDQPTAHPPPRHFLVFCVCEASGICSLRVTVLLVCPNRPPDVYVCWAHGFLFIVGAMCSHIYCLPPLILLPNHCFSCSTCVSLITLVCLPI